MDSSTSNSEPASQPISPVPYGAAFVVAAVLLFTGQFALIRKVDGRPGKGESNFFSSLARVQRACAAECEMALVGSSVTGRLPDRTAGIAGIANLGIDGGNGLDGLRAIEDGLVQVRRHVVIETNTLAVGLHAKDVQVSDGFDGLWFQLGKKFPLFSYSARPTSMIYLLARSRSSADAGAAATPPAAPSLGPEVITRLPELPLPALEEGRVDRMCQGIETLKQRGILVTLVQYPPAANETSMEYRMAAAISARCQIPLWNLGRALPKDTYVLTDGIHLDARSAREVTELLHNALDLRQ